MTLGRYVRGISVVRVCGENYAECLSNFAQEGLSFWDIRQKDRSLEMSIFSKDLDRALSLCLSACCDLQEIKVEGFPLIWQKLKKRPLLLLGLLACILLSFYLQKYVWSVEIRGADSSINYRINQLLQDRGIGFGTAGETIDSQRIKLDMLQQLPELSWLAVNRRGARLTVFYLANGSDQKMADSASTNLLALRDAVITEYSVSEGMRLFSMGEAVRKGQVLVSGFEDYGLCLRAVRSQGEIYGETWRSGMILRPAVCNVKKYTGREWTEISLIIGRKRINLCGNSGISTTRCDKIINEQKFSLPNLELPLRLQVVRYREYTLTPVVNEADCTEAEMLQAWSAHTQGQMVAGEILDTEHSFLRQGDFYLLHVNSQCREMIAVEVPMEDLYKGDTYE